MTKDLFQEFNPTNKMDWTAQVSREVKGQNILQKLSSELWDRLTIVPFYTKEDLKIPVMQHRFNSKSDLSDMPPRLWHNLVNVLPGFSNSDILNSLENGAEGIILPIHGVEDLSELLADILPQHIPIIVQPLGNPIFALKAFFDWVDSTGNSPNSITGGLFWTPSDLVFEQNEPLGLGYEILSELLEMCDPYPSFKAFCIKTSRYTESGSNPLEAIVFGLGEFIDVVDHLKLEPNLIFSNVFLEASVGENHFGEIARMKAFRTAFKELSFLYSLDFLEEEFLLFCHTSHWSKSILDPNTNLIRQTYEAMAAVLGGANWLWVKPIEEEPTETERRISRNVSAILREESYFDKVMDPSAGSFYLETLISEIFQFLKKNLLELENQGGWTKALERGDIHRAVRMQREKAQNQIFKNNIFKIGVNKFPAHLANLKNRDLEPFKEKSYELNPTRAAYITELQTLNES